MRNLSDTGLDPSPEISHVRKNTQFTNDLVSDK